jgi:transposase
MKKDRRLNGGGLWWSLAVVAHRCENIARRFQVSAGTVYYWVQRAGHQSLAELDWNDRSRAPHTTTRSQRAIEDLVLTIRRDLKENSVLGE